MSRFAAFVGVFLWFGNLSAFAAPDGDLSAIPQSAPAPRIEIGGDTPPPAANLFFISMPAPRAEPGSDARPPSGYVAFCERNPRDCQAPRNEPGQVPFTLDIWATLQKVNLVVNGAIRPMDDIDHYATKEYWTVPVDGEGDCEDYVLAKRKMLTLLGLPVSALRITVALNERRVRHAVLMVVTDRGDYVLDNTQDEILSPDRVGYTWLERQDSSSRTGWIAMN